MNNIDVLNDRLLNINDQNIARFTTDIYLSDNIIETKDGYLLCKNVIMGRTGYQKYLGKELVDMGFLADEVVDVFRGEEEVFAEDSLNSAIGKPVTLGHPNVDVNIYNIKELGKGYIVGKPTREGELLVGDVMITDLDLIYLIKSKKLRELSLGYNTKLVRDGNEVRQTDIYINHLAVVEDGRAGVAMIIDEQNEKIKNKEDNNLLDELKKQGIHIHINLDDKKEVKKEDEEETKKDVEEKEVEKDNKKEEDKDKKDKKDKEVKEKVKDEDKEEEKEKEKEEMDEKKLAEVVSKIVQEELSKLKHEVKDSAKLNDNVFGKIDHVTNEVTSQEIKDHSLVTGNEMADALQAHHDKHFSFRGMVRQSDGDLTKVKSNLYNSKDIHSKDLIKEGGNK